jgi:hypothetical protein
VQFVSVRAICPPGVPDSVICHARTGTGVVAGLGRVSETYLFMADRTLCGTVAAKVLAYSARLSVAGKGDLELAVEGLPECIPELAVPGASPQAFTVTGGTGAYVGASGSGTLTRIAVAPGLSVTGADTWTATIVAPGLEFDVTAPTISGAASKALRAPRKGEACACEIPGHRDRRSRRIGCGLVPTRFGQPLQGRSHARDVLRH